MVIAFAIFSVLLWHNIHAHNVPLPSARGDIGAPMLVQTTDTIAHAAISRVALMIGAVSEVPQDVGVPVRIEIPGIAVDAVVQRVALTDNRLMDVPTLPQDTGWFELGPRPGEIGSATIAGHVSWEHGAAGVFADLDKVKLGDKVIVRDDRGAAASFVVRDIRTYDAQANAIEVFDSRDGKAHLNLITCDGAWDTAVGGYPSRLVVFTDKE